MAKQDINININGNDNASSAFSRVSAGLGGVAAKAAIVAAAIAAAFKVASVALDEYGKQEDAINRLNAALQIQGTYSDALSKHLQRLSERFQFVSRYGDEAIVGVMEKFITLGNVAPAKLEALTKATIDYAAATGRDLDSAATVVTNSVNGYDRELKRLGLDLSTAYTASEKLERVQKLLEDRFGSRAQKDLNSYTGSIAMLKNAWSDLLETIGGKLAPLAKATAGLLTKALRGANTVITGAGKQNGTPENPIELDDIIIGEEKVQSKFVQIWRNFKMTEMVAQQTAQNMEQSFTNIFFDAFRGQVASLKSYMISFGNMMLQMFAQILAKMAVIRIFQSIGGAFGSAGVAAAGGTAQSAGTAAGAHQLGTEYIPRTGMYLLHGGEKVVPSHKSNDKEPRGGIVINMNVQAWDTTDVMRNKRTLAAAIAEELDRNNPTLAMVGRRG